MHSRYHSMFGLPQEDCQVEPVRMTSTGEIRITFRSESNRPGVSLDIGGAHRLREFMKQAGEIEQANELTSAIDAAQRLWRATGRALN
jgi:hypothetical protein